MKNKMLFWKCLFRMASFLYFSVCFFNLFTGYAHAYIDPSAVTYMIQAVAAVAIAAGAALTVFRHKIAALFRKNKSLVNHREIHLKNGWEDLFEVPGKKDMSQNTNKKKAADKKNILTKQKKYSVTEDLYQ